MQSIDEELVEIEQKLMKIAKHERELLLRQRKLRCLRDKHCSVSDFLSNIQIG